MDISVFRQAERLVRSAVSGLEGNPNWTNIFKIISLFEQNPAGIQTYLHAIAKDLGTSSFAQRMNTCILVDALFQNSKPPELKLLQSSVLMDALKTPGISLEPLIHNFLYKVMPEWLKILRKGGVLNKKFEKFVTDYIEWHYARFLTPKIRKKFIQDLTGVTEVLTMFGDCLLSTETGQVDRGLLAEIVANVQEITRRLFALEPTIVEGELRGAVIAARDCADVMLQMERDWSERHGKVDAQLAHAVLDKLRKAMQIAIDPKKSLHKGVRTPPRAQAADRDDITDQEFFEKLAILKQGGTTAAAPVVESLLDLGEAPPAGVNPFTAPEPAKDDLVDSLLEI